MFILQEVFDYEFAVFTKDGFRMELDTVDRVFDVADAHDFSVLNGFRGYLEAVWDGFAFARKRMVPCGGEGVADAFEDGFLVVFYGAGFAVHEFFCVDDFSAVSVDYSLVPKANAQRWDGWA